MSNSRPLTSKPMDDVLEFLRSFISGGVNQDFKPWASELYQKLYRTTDETCERRNQDERTLRRLLAFAYSGSALYGDDGELQDGRHPMIDYVRDSIADIERKIHERGMAKLAAAACPECRYVIGHKAGCSSKKAGEQPLWPWQMCTGCGNEPNACTCDTQSEPEV